METVFLDTNILLRHVLGDHPEHSPRATAFLERIEKGEVEAHIADTVIFETVFTLQRTYKQPRDRIASALLPLIELPGIVLPGKRHYRKVFALYRSGPLGFADCYHVVLMQRLRIDEILSFDTHFDHISDLTRREF